jgi:hypothetical protein
MADEVYRLRIFGRHGTLLHDSALGKPQRASAALDDALLRSVREVIETAQARIIVSHEGEGSAGHCSRAINLAHAMRIRVTGEGVETQAQLKMLARHGCDAVQGFLLGKPAPAEQLEHAAATMPDSPTRGGLQPDVALLG